MHLINTNFKIPILKQIFFDEESSGERKVNLIRLAAITIFFLVALLNRHVLDVVDARIHARTLWILGVWAIFATTTWYGVNKRRYYSSWVKYASASVDISFLTFTIIALEANSGPLISLYYILIAHSALRSSRRAAITVTGLSIVGYAAVWYFSFGNPAIHSVSTHAAIIHILAMCVMGWTVGYTVKKMQLLVFKFAENLVRREMAESALRRYVSHQVAKKILDSPDAGASMGEGRRTHVAILFSDIRGFTPMSESMEPEALLELINKYFGRMVDIVFKHNGTLDKFVGDALIVVFNDPCLQSEAEKIAVACAVEMQKEMLLFNREQEVAGKKTLDIGIGVHCGIVVAGNVGSESRMDYTVIGDTVNFTARLQGQTPAGAIHVSSAILAKTAADFTYRSLGLREFKGCAEPSEVYEVVGR